METFNQEGQQVNVQTPASVKRPLTLEDAQIQLSNLASRALIGFIEQLEYEGFIWGNGHHSVQNWTAYLQEQLAKIWKDPTEMIPEMTLKEFKAQATPGELYQLEVIRQLYKYGNESWPVAMHRLYTLTRGRLNVTSCDTYLKGE